MKKHSGPLSLAGGLYAIFFGSPGRGRPLFISLLETLCTILFVTMAVVLFCQTTARMAGYSIFWAEELARYAMVWLIFLGSTVAVHNGSHTRIAVFVNLLPSWSRNRVEALVNLLCALIIGVIAYTGITVYKVAMMGKSSAMEIPLGCVFGSVTFCGALMVLFFVNRAILQMLGRPLPEEERPVAPEEKER